MGNDTYEENKRLKREIENLEIALRVKAETDALPKLIESVTIAFLQGRAAFDVCAVNINATPAWSIRFRVDPPPAPPRQPSDAS